MRKNKHSSNKAALTLLESNIQAKLQIEQIDIDKLIPNPYNPRTWDEQQKDQLKESLLRFGQVDPLLVNGSLARKNILIGGHMRLECMKELGLETVQVVYLDIEDEYKERELCLRLNKNSGSWDWDLLKDFDLTSLLDIGFGDDELNSIWDNLIAIEDDEDFDLEKALERAKSTDIKLGDKFSLGGSLLICGDSTEIDNFKYIQKYIQERVGVDGKISCTINDPPYNIGLSYNKGTGSKSNYGGKHKDSMKLEDYNAFLLGVMNNAKTVLSADAHIFVFCDQNYVGLFQNLITEIGAKNQRTCIWIKNAFMATPQCAFNKLYEPCLYATVGKPYLNGGTKNLSEVLNKEASTGNRLHDDILDMLDIWIAKRDNVSDYSHPTQKPLSLLEKPIRRCTKPGDYILDCFGGSGTTLLAAHQLKRRAILIEKEPIFCQVILDRYESMTNEKGVKL